MSFQQGHNSAGVNSNLVDAIVEAFKALDYGQTLTFDQIFALVDLPKYRARTIINRARLKATKQGVFVSNVPTVGYERVKPEDAENYVATKDRVKARRHTFRWRDRIRTIDRSALPEDKRQRLSTVANSVGSLSAMLTPKNLVKPAAKPKTQTRIRAGNLSSMQNIE